MPGKKRFIKDLHGEAVRDIGVVVEPKSGKALALSLDLRLQYAQHRELQRAMKETGAAAGSAVTIDAWTGEVLAASNYPVFNPNSRSAFDFGSARNRAFTDAFEPGSTIKTLTLVAALESELFHIEAWLTPTPEEFGWERRCSMTPVITARFQFPQSLRNRVRSGSPSWLRRWVTGPYWTCSIALVWGCHGNGFSRWRAGSCLTLTVE